MVKLAQRQDSGLQLLARTVTNDGKVVIFSKTGAGVQSFVFNLVAKLGTKVVTALWGNELDITTPLQAGSESKCYRYSNEQVNDAWAMMSMATAYDNVSAMFPQEKLRKALLSLWCEGSVGGFFTTYGESADDVFKQLRQDFADIKKPINYSFLSLIVRFIVEVDEEGQVVDIHRLCMTDDGFTLSKEVLE
ncbi:hypothetical protein [Bacillus thuringiensis]|uniref:hypothetical protein n=1 Tax=Bacillus thuringiensis TaxID=1428 RepID=UPI000BFD5D54|nr:hypothetical protein [Bacillus thuringiensis]PGT90115.1 hypothetical protein COD17_10215 [Bacillus thuringiensis]